jgi:hypothetical protein
MRMPSRSPLARSLRWIGFAVLLTPALASAHHAITGQFQQSKSITLGARRISAL